MIDFWPKTAISQENPIVTFKNKLYIETLFIDPTKGDGGNSVSGNMRTYEYATVKSVRDHA